MELGQDFPKAGGGIGGFEPSGSTSNHRVSWLAS
jgi:hypothetical protein